MKFPTVSDFSIGEEVAAVESIAEQEVRAFAAYYSTAPAVQQAVRYAEEGRISWESIRDLFTTVLGNFLAELKNEGAKP